MNTNNPNLAGVIEIKDVHQLPTGFKAKYMAWAKVASIFNEKCPGWTHHTKMNEQDGTPLFDAPDGSMYFIFYFQDPEGNKFSDFIYPKCFFLFIIFLISGFYYAFFISPPDYLQGETVRIMYIHVPCAWLSLGIYSMMAGCSFFSIVFKHTLADIISRACAPLGACFTLATLITGSIWGKPTWGTWWVWDARLTSELVLLFIYLGHIFISNG